MVTVAPDLARPRRRRPTTYAAVLACVLGLAVGPALGVSAAVARTEPDTQRKAIVDKRISQLKGDLDDTSQSLAAAAAALDATNAKLPGARAALAGAQGAVASADTRNEEAAAELAVARANQAKAELELRSTRGSIDGARAQVAAFAAQIYQDQGLGQLSVAMSATSPSDFADRISMMGTYLDVQKRTMGDLSTAEAVQLAQEAHLSALRADSARAKAAAEGALATATEARDAAASAKAALDSLAAQQTSQTASLATRRAEELKQLRSMQAESDHLKAVLAERARLARIAAAKARTRGTVGAGGFLSAAELGQPITSEYGIRFHPILHIWRMHTGLDFGGACGTPVYAAGPGTIISAGRAGGYGNRVVIDHGLVSGVDLATTYNHMVRIVRFGGHVSRGQLIGYEGTTGMSTGCHLHFETLENGRFVNPRKWL